MKIGDLIKIKECNQQLDVLHPLYKPCYCFFCSGKSNRVGMITGPVSRNRWSVMFDCGEAIVDDFEEARGEVIVINSTLSDEQLEHVRGGMSMETFNVWKTEVINEKK